MNYCVLNDIFLDRVREVRHCDGRPQHRQGLCLCNLRPEGVRRLGDPRDGWGDPQWPADQGQRG